MVAIIFFLVCPDGILRMRHIIDFEDRQLIDRPRIEALIRFSLTPLSASPLTHPLFIYSFFKAVSVFVQEITSDMSAYTSRFI